MRSYFLHGSIFCLGIYIPVSKPSICFWKWVISNKWRNKLLIHNIKLTGHRKSACCLQLLVFLEIRSLLCFGIGRSRFFPRVAATMISKRFCEIAFESVLLNVMENMKERWLVFCLSLLFTHLVKGLGRAGGWNKKYLGNRLLVTWFFWLLMIICDYFSSVFCILPKKV